MRMFINSDRDIDYTVLNGRISKAEKQDVALVSDSLLEQYVSSGILTEQELADINFLVKRKNKYENIKINNTRTKTGALKNELSKAYELGLIYQSGYTLVEMDLSTCMLQVIQIISGLTKEEDFKFTQDISHLRKELGDLFCGEIEDDNLVQSLIENLLELDNDILNAYIYKAITLSKVGDIITVDMFNVERKYKKLFPLEAISIPISYSLNTLQYVIIEELRNGFRRGEKRFAGINRCKIYYFVRNDIVDKFVETEFVLDGVKLDIKYYKNKPLKFTNEVTS